MNQFIFEYDYKSALLYKCCIVTDHSADSEIAEHKAVIVATAPESHPK